jgi:hypothetical protein
MREEVRLFVAQVGGSELSDKAKLKVQSSRGGNADMMEGILDGLGSMQKDTWGVDKGGSKAGMERIEGRTRRFSCHRPRYRM